MVDTFAAEIKATPTDKIESKKADVVQLNNILQYLAKFQIAEFAAADGLQQIVTAHGWDKKK